MDASRHTAVRPVPRYKLAVVTWVYVLVPAMQRVFAAWLKASTGGQ